MDLRTLSYFVAVAEHGGVTRAAKALFIAQPSLSRAIHGLEAEVGADLFERTPRGVQLTAAGEALLGPARTALREAEGARRAVDEVQRLERGRLTIAADPTLTVTRLPEQAGALRSRHPGVTLSVEDPGGAGGVVDAVLRGHAEVGLLPLTADTGRLVQHRLWTERTVLVVPEAIATDLPDPIPIEAVRALPLVLEVDDHLAPVVSDPVLTTAIGEVAVRCVHRAAVWDLVGRGAGATLVPERLAQRLLTHVPHRRLDPDPTYPVGVIHRPGQLSPAASAFTRLALAEAD
ncbi:LysR family transcriptional regulator [Kribbia dieselivorans]|uniref:LysR family transcriptional regulator n=1 Tax=Kribbia dieselivorans TaxID=331526 RepID=UPI000837CB56|nr:LysR family transcriptional regulator [Kribbia dieselivorans]